MATNYATDYTSKIANRVNDPSPHREGCDDTIQSIDERYSIFHHMCRRQGQRFSILLMIFCVIRSNTFSRKQLEAFNHEGISASSTPSGMIRDSFYLTEKRETYTYHYPKKFVEKMIKTVREEGHDPYPTLLFGILTSPNTKQARDALRQTWANRTSHFFVLAGSLTQDVMGEIKAHSDIVHLEAEEDYRTGLTRKSMMAIHFTNHLCHRHQICVDYLFKTDDDAYVNVTQLQLELAQQHNSPDYYGLAFRKRAPIRSKSSRFYISKKEYAPNHFPDYASGIGYAVSKNLVSCMSKQMKLGEQQMIVWEDVAVGLLAHQCHANITNSKWKLPGMKRSMATINFPQLILEEGGVQVTVVHRIKRPDYFLPIHLKQPLPA